MEAEVSHLSFATRKLFLLRKLQYEIDRYYPNEPRNQFEENQGYLSINENKKINTDRQQIDGKYSFMKVEFRNGTNTLE